MSKMYEMPLEVTQANMNYQKYREIYDGEHYTHLYKKRSLFSKSEYSATNFIKRIIDFRTSLLLTNKPLIKSQTREIQEWIEESLFDSNFYNKLKYYTVDGEITGSIIFMVSYPKRYGRAVIDLVPADFYIPFYKDRRGVELVENRAVFDNGDTIKVVRDFYDEKENSYVYEELHYNKIEGIIIQDPKKTINFNHDYGFLIHCIKLNPKMSSTKNGSSVEDYSELNAQINLLNSMIDIDLEKTGRTRAEVDEDFYDTLQEAGISVAKKRGMSDEQIEDMQAQGHAFINIDNVQLIPKREGNTSAFNYVSFQASTDKFIMERDKRLNMLAVISSTPTSVLKAEGNVAQSGTALRLQMTETLLKTTELAEKLKYALSKALYQMQEIELKFGKAPFKEAEKISVQFVINLPTDEQQQNMILNKRNSQLISLKTTLQELYPHWTEEQILEELALLEEEQSKADESLSRGAAFPPLAPPQEEDETEEALSEEADEVVDGDETV